MKSFKILILSGTAAAVFTLIAVFPCMAVGAQDQQQPQSSETETEKEN